MIAGSCRLQKNAIIAGPLLSVFSHHRGKLGLIYSKDCRTQAVVRPIGGIPRTKSQFLPRAA